MICTVLSEDPLSDIKIGKLYFENCGNISSNNSFKKLPLLYVGIYKPNLRLYSKSSPYTSEKPNSLYPIIAYYFNCHTYPDYLKDYTYRGIFPRAS